MLRVLKGVDVLLHGGPATRDNVQAGMKLHHHAAVA